MAARVFLRGGQSERGDERDGAVGLVFVVLGALKDGGRLRVQLDGPGRMSSFMARPAFTVASIAAVILSRNALICSSVLPDTDSSLAMMTCAMESLFFSAC
jgi:hypothetical protein